MKKKILLSIFSAIVLFIALALNAKVNAVAKLDFSEIYPYVSLDTYTYEYTGKEIKPKINKVSYYDTKAKKTVELKKDKDYTVKYDNNINIGYGYIILTGKGNYKGSYTNTFTICKYSIENAIVPSIPNQTYNGKVITPKIQSVKYKTKDGKTLTLKEDEDYYFIKNTQPTQVGISSLYIYGKGDFAGYKGIPFYVLPSAIKNLKAEQNSNTIKLTWNKPSEYISGYEIERKANTDKKYAKLTTVYSKDTNTYTDYAIQSGKQYSYRVRAYYYTWNSNTKKNENIYGKYSNIAQKAYISKVNFKVTSYNQKATISWDKVSGVAGYQIFRATSKNGQYTKIATKKGMNSLKYTDKSIKAFTTYYYKVRGYLTISAKDLYGPFSGVKEKTPLEKAKITKIKKKKKKIKVSWNKIQSISGYEVYRAVSLNGKYKKVATVSSKKNSYTEKKITLGKAYAYKIRAIKKGSLTLYGDFSDKKFLATGSRKQQMNKISLSPDKEFKNSSFSSYYKDYESLIKKYAKSKKSTYDKVKAMYKFLVTHLYHKDGYHCKNYAGTFASMCRVIGLDAYCATGETRTGKGGYTAHTWTVININGKEYIFDASLERHNSDRNKGKVQYRYFFKKYSELKGVYKQYGYENMFPYFMVPKAQLVK